jgi:putative lipoprotein
MQTIDRRQFAAGLALAPLLSAIAIRVAAGAETRVSGTVAYRERIALPENATLTVQLVELIEDAVAGKTIAEQVISPAGQVPVPFGIAYDPAALAEGARLGLKARITAESAVLFENPEPQEVDPAAPEGIELMLERASDGAAETPPISDIEWTVEEITGLDGLADTAPTLSIALDGRAGGHGGCNRFFATATIEGDQIGFSEIGSTFMACEAAVMEVEQAYFAALAATVSYRIEGGRLELLDAQGQLTVALTAAV